MNLKGKLTHKLDVVTGQGNNGEWKKQTIVITTNEQYPKDVAIDLWKDNVTKAESFNIDDTLDCEIDVSSREYNGKWYTNVKAWKISKVEVTEEVTEEDKSLPF